eukprot:255655-Rhodomonas_salina.1
MKDLVTLLPMLDELCVLQMTGAQLLEALENGVSMYPKLEGRFPCVSGIRFEFDAAMPPTNRIIPGTLQVGERPLDLSASYNVATKYYLASGKDGYTVFTKCNVISDGEGTPLLPDLIRQQVPRPARSQRPTAAPRSARADGTDMCRPDRACGCAAASLCC